MTRVCYIIIAHSEPNNLAGLLCSLWNERDHFHVIIDPKFVDDILPELSASLSPPGNVTFALGHVMAWGGFSIVRTTLDALRWARGALRPSYYVLCSGTRVPLQNPDQIYASLQSLKGYMDWSAFDYRTLVSRAASGERQPREILDRISYDYHEYPGLGMVPFRRRASWPLKRVFKGSQWFIFGDEACEASLSAPSDLLDALSTVNVCDEAYFPHVLDAAKFLPMLRRGSHVHAEWDGMSPKRLTFQQCRQQAVSSSSLFVRKPSREASLVEWQAYCADVLHHGAGFSKLASGEQVDRSILPVYGNPAILDDRLPREFPAFLADALSDGRDPLHFTKVGELYADTAYAVSAFVSDRPICVLVDAAVHIATLTGPGTGAAVLLCVKSLKAAGKFSGFAPIPYLPDLFNITPFDLRTQSWIAANIFAIPSAAKEQIHALMSELRDVLPRSLLATSA